MSRLAIRQIAILVLGLAFVAPASAVTLFENAAVGSTQGYCEWECLPGYRGAENFTLGSDSVVEALSVGVLLGQTANLTGMTVDWYLHDGPGSTPGALITSGTVTPTVTNLGAFPLFPSLDLGRLDLDIVDANLLAGDYWAAFRINLPNDLRQVFWLNTSDGDGIHARYASNTNSWVSQYPLAPNPAPPTEGFVFSVIGPGPANTAPEPAMPALLGIGLGLLALVGRRRRS